MADDAIRREERQVLASSRPSDNHAAKVVAPVGQFVRSIPNHVRKNRGLIVNRDFWQAVPVLLSGGLARVVRPTSGDEMTRFVATHHKVMTTYFSAVLRLMAMATGSSFAKQGFRGGTPSAGLILSMHSTIDLEALSSYRGVHVMRDPRDVIVSSYFYHRWTEEPWAHRLDGTGRSYQQRLNGMSQSQGLHLEIAHFVSSYGDLLRRWNVNDPDILEVKFDSLMGGNRSLHYTEIFRHLGYRGRELEIGCRLMRAFEASARTGSVLDRPRNRSHVRLAQSGQWKQLLSQSHHRHLDRELGPVLDKFGFS